MWKDFFYFTRRERYGILILIVLIVGIFIGKYFLTKPNSQMMESQVQPNILGVESEGENTSTKAQSKTYYQQPSKNQSHYRQPKTKLPEERTYYQHPRDTVRKIFAQSEKYVQGTIVNINLADSTELIKIPGVGQSFASRILKYRQILGGYYSKEQLKEVYGMYVELYEKIAPFIATPTDSLRKIPVNSSSVERLKAHPYINFYQAKAIVELRKKKGKLENISELSLLEEFTEADLERIRCYLVF